MYGGLLYGSVDGNACDLLLSRCIASREHKVRNRFRKSNANYYWAVIGNGPLGIMGTVTTVVAGQSAGLQFVVVREIVPTGPLPQSTVIQFVESGPTMFPPVTTHE
jgi:hypothetical protein